jgi:glycosyltransferase involved in cell wall biosynthesis
VRLVFAHDTWFIRAPDGRVFTDRGSFPWDRYLEFASSITVVSRMRDLNPGESTERMALASHPQVSFVELPNLATPVGRFVKRRSARRSLTAVLEQADALVARLPSEIGGLACWVAHDLGLPWAVELVTCPWDAIWNYGNWKGRVFAPVAWWETRRLLKRAPFSLYVTSQFLQRRYPPGGHAVGVSDVEIAVDPTALKQRLARQDEGPLVFGTIAALLPFKGFDTAFAALGRARPALPPFEFRVLGAGDVDQYRRMADAAGVADVVHFDGTRPAGAPVLEWLDAIDVYLQPSRQEGLPRAMVEAMSRACPALGSTAGGIPELLDADSLHKPGDAAGLARLLVRSADPQWRRAQAARNVEVAAAYAPDVLDARRREFWQAFAGGRGLRVLFVTPYAQLGGSERQLLHLLDGLDPDQVAGVVSLQEGPLLERLHHPVVIPTGAGLVDLLRSARALRPVLRAARPTVVHASCAKGALVAGLAAVGTGVPVLFAKHDFYSDGPVAWGAAVLCKEVVAGSHALLETFPSVLRTRLHVVHPGVPGGEPVVPEDVADCTIGMVARFHPDKGHLEIVEALATVPEARLLLIGGVDRSTPEFMGQVERRVAELGLKDRVELTGERDDVVSLLAGCDVAVVPSLVPEGFGLAAVEAMRAGTPVVAYRTGALPEAVGDCGVLVAPGDRAALAAAVARLLADPAERARLAQCGRERAEQFTVEAMVTGYRDHWLSLSASLSAGLGPPSRS